MPKAYYLKLGSGGSQLFGASRDPHHVGWIKLDTFYWGNAKYQSPSGGPGKAVMSEFIVSKAADRISPQLMQAAMNGMAFKSAIIEVADSTTGIPTVRMNLSDVLIINYSGTGYHGAEGDAFTINYLNIEFNHTPIAEDVLEDVLQSVFQFMWIGGDRQAGRP